MRLDKLVSASFRIKERKKDLFLKIEVLVGCVLFSSATISFNVMSIHQDHGIILIKHSLTLN